MDLNRNLICLLPLLLAASSPLWWSAAGDILEPGTDYISSVPKSSGQSKKFFLDQVVLVQNRGGRENLTIKAARVRSEESGDLLQMDDVEAHLRDHGEQPTVLKSGEAFFNSTQQVLTVLDNVRIETPEGQKMRTEALRYLTRYNKIKTAEDIWVKGSGGEIRGTSLFYDLDSGDFRVGGRVKVDFQ